MAVPENLSFEVAVVGAGPAGLVAGLACAAFGLSTVIIGPRSDLTDGRTAALLDGSINLLKRLEAWDTLKAKAEPLKAIRLVDAEPALLQAPEVLFDATEIGLPAFGYSVANADLTAALEGLCSPRLSRLVTAGVADIDLNAEVARLTTRDGAIVDARLVVAADGRASLTRSAAGIGVSSWSYDQAALVASFSHSRPHRGISTELHRDPGPLTVVPGPGNTSSLVWVERPDAAARLKDLDDAEFAAALEHHLNGLLGRVSALSPRKTFPLAGQTAKTLGRQRIALVGEAAHVLPPIGAQGLNLGFRDAATIADVAFEAARGGEDIGSPAILARYDAQRQSDIGSRVFAVDLLNRSLLSGFPGVHVVRGLGLVALASSRALRSRIMREGVMPAAGCPSLMRPLTAIEDIGAVALDGGVYQRA